MAVYYVDTLCCDYNKWAQNNVSAPDVEVQSNIISKIPRLERKDIILMEDFDIDLLNNSPDAKKFLRFSELNGLLQTINKPTRISPTSTSMIDLIFRNMTHVHSSGTLDLFLSNHLPIYLIKKMNTSLGKKNQDINLQEEHNIIGIIRQKPGIILLMLMLI